MYLKTGTSEYRKLHYWVAKNLGKPMKCANCGTTEKKRYHWANISQDYKYDLTDWIRLCVPCHFRQATELLSEQCMNGHRLTEDNIYCYPSGRVECRTCRRERHKESNEKTNPLRYKKATEKESTK